MVIIDSFIRRISWFGLVMLYGISTFFGYLMPNPIHTLYIPTPPHEHDATQGQFLIWFEISFTSPRLLIIPKLKSPVWLTILPIDGGRIGEFILFARVLAFCQMQKTHPEFELRSLCSFPTTLSTIYIYSSCRVVSTDFPNSLSTIVSISHRFQLVFKTTSCVCTELLLTSSCWSANTCMSVWKGSIA